MCGTCGRGAARARGGAGCAAVRRDARYLDETSVTGCQASPSAPCVWRGVHRLLPARSPSTVQSVQRPHACVARATSRTPLKVMHQVCTFNMCRPYRAVVSRTALQASQLATCPPRARRSSWHAGGGCESMSMVQPRMHSAVPRPAVSGRACCEANERVPVSALSRHSW